MKDRRVERDWGGARNMKHQHHRHAAQHFPPWLLAFAFLFLSVIFWFLLFPHAAASSAQLKVGKRVLTLEVAETNSAREQGLSGRASLGRDAGMLFVFPKSGVYPFWMKDMHFSLDMVWVSHGKVVDVVSLPPPSPTSTSIPAYTPRASADMVIELNEGEAQTLGLIPGGRVNIQK
jgi:uncharacterized protein